MVSSSDMLQVYTVRYIDGYEGQFLMDSREHYNTVFDSLLR